MSRQLRRGAARRVEQVLLGGRARSEFDVEVLAFVDGVSDLAYRLEQRGWLGQGSGSDVAWDWPATALTEADGATGGGQLLPCTSVSVSDDLMSILVTLVGQPDRPSGEMSVTFEQLSDHGLAELEAHRPDRAVPAWLQNRETG